MLSQVQIIRSLGEALGWMEKELSWGAPLAELRFLTGRIGELYAAMLTRGQMATAVNQRGYDVVSGEGERISVKTVTTSNRVPFTAQTFDLVDRIMVLRINVDDDDGLSIETLLDVPRAEFNGNLRTLSSGEIDFPIRAVISRRPLVNQIVLAERAFESWTVRQYESGTIEVLENGNVAPAAAPVLRHMAARLGVDLRNGNDQPRNTRQLGSAILEAIGNLP